MPAGLDGVRTDDADCTIRRIGFEAPFVRTIAAQLDGRHADMQIRSRLRYLAWTPQAELEMNRLPGWGPREIIRNSK